jgi:hypothetical protein
MFTTDQILNAKNGADRKAMIAQNIKAGPWAWVARAVEVIYERQTADEQSDGQTKHHNGIGFNGVDAAILSSFARQVKAWKATPEGERRFPCPLSARQLELARKKMAKYSGQLAAIAAEKAAPAPVEPPPAPTPAPEPEPEFTILTIDREDMPEPGMYYTDRKGVRWYCENFADYLYCHSCDLEEAGQEEQQKVIDWETDWLEQVQTRLERVRARERHPRASRYWK